MKSFDISFQNVRVLCLGDLILDRFVYGTVNRISPEAPVPILKTNRDFLTLGGAGNVVRNLSSLGCQTTFIGILGKDEAGVKVKDLLADVPHVVTHLTLEGRTPYKSRFVSQSQQLLRVDDEVLACPTQETLTILKKAIADHLPYVDVVILSDYGKGSLPSDLCRYVIQAAKAAHIPVVVDPKGHDYTRYQGATLLTPNEKELSEVSPYPVTCDEDVIKAGTALRDLHHIEAVLVTRGPKGMTLIPPKGHLHIPTRAQEIFDVSGAGDTVIATLSASLGAGHPLEEAAKLANEAAGIVVGKVGTAVVKQSELAAALLKTTLSSTSCKIMSLEEAKDQAQTWRRQGLTIGFTNGCFDLLHLGHLHILEQSKKTCDRLVIGLNTDTSVQRLKGSSRPIQSEAVRSQVLAALEYVDGVVLFEDDTPLSLITTLLPDTLCKGADYAIHEVVGADIVHLNGGKVCLIDLKPGYSTTATLIKVQNQLPNTANAPAKPGSAGVVAS
jgi:D-beta-D-heptose 7-phosphate kinase/D-beta-D-heptose 1-phosphate adenosyltransferase